MPPVICGDGKTMYGAASPVDGFGRRRPIMPSASLESVFITGNPTLYFIVARVVRMPVVSAWRQEPRLPVPSA